MSNDDVAGTSELVVIDAANMEPLATLASPVPVPYSFHGDWEPA